MKLEQPPNQEIKGIPEFTVHREEGLALVSRLLKEGVFEDVGDEEAVFMLGLLHGHPEREEDVMRQLKKYKPHVEDQEKLKNRILQALASSEKKAASPAETGRSRWEADADVAKEHIARLMKYFQADYDALGIERVTIVPSDDLLLPQKGSSFRANGETIIMVRSGVWSGFDHEFLHGVVNPAVEGAVSQLSDEEKKRVVQLAKPSLKSVQGYGEIPESLLQETIIRTYTNFIQEGKPKPDKKEAERMVASLNEEDFEKAKEWPTTKEQFDQMGIKTLEDLRKKWETYFKRFGRDELQERVYDFLKRYEYNKESFADFLNTRVRELLKHENPASKNNGDRAEEIGDKAGGFEKGREMKEGGPKIELHFSFGEHYSKEDFDSLKSEINKYDVYVPEAMGWIKLIESSWNMVARGEKTPDEAMAGLEPKSKDGGSAVSHKKEGGYLQSSVQREAELATTRATFEILYGTNKKVIMLDISLWNLLTLFKNIRAISAVSKAGDLFKGGKFDESLDAYDSALNKYKKVNQMRENIILKNIENRLRQEIANDEELSQKSTVRVLVRIGALHTPLYHSLKHRGESVTRDFRQSLYRFPPGVASVRKVIFDRKPSKADEARDLVSNMVLESLLPNKSWFKNTREMMDTIEILSERLDNYVENHTSQKKDFDEATIEEAEAISRALGTGVSIQDEFEKRGIKFPSNEEDVRAMI